MRRGLLLVLLGLTACHPPLERDCGRVLVDSAGELNFGGVPATGVPPVGVVGTPLTLALFSPLSSCASDTVRADPQLLDPDGQPVPVTLEGEAQRSGAQAAVKASVTFTPTRPGLHTLHVAFEPSLGVRSLLLDVASLGLSGAVTRVPIPPCVPSGLWPVSDDTVACEAAGRVTLSSSDGGSIDFPGEQLVVVDTVLWSIDAASATLERRQLEDGGVRRTHAFAPFAARPTPAMQEENLALRFRPNGRLALVRVGPGGETVQELPPEPPAQAWFAEDHDLFRWSAQPCFLNACINLPDVVGLEPGLVWRGSPLFTAEPTATQTFGYARPTTAFESTPRFTLLQPIESVDAPAAGFERLPLWLEADAGLGQQVLASLDDGALHCTAWPRAEVLRVGRHHVLLSDSEAGWVRIIRR